MNQVDDIDYNDNSGNKKKGLSKGAIAAIVIVVIIVVAVIIVVSVILVKKYNSNGNFQLMSSLSRNESNDIGSV